MISFNFNLRNPWSDTFKNLWCRSYATPFEHKFIELEVTQDSTLVCVMFNWTIRQSHAGLDVEAGVFGYNIHFQFYDNRHWDATTKQWQSDIQLKGLTMSTVLVKFYRLNTEGVAVVCRTEICASVMEADFLASDEMSRGAYSNIVIEQPD